VISLMRRSPVRAHRPPIVVATNINVHTAPCSSPLVNDVLSWAWRSRDESDEEVLELLRSHSRYTLRRFPDGEHRADSYLRGKRVFERSPVGFLRALSWLTVRAATADRVVIKLPSADPDGLLTVAVLVVARIAGTPVWHYSETWLLPVGARHLGRRLFYRAVTVLAGRVMVPSGLHCRFHEELGARRVELIPSIYCPAPNVPSQFGPSRAEPLGLLHVGRLIECKGLDRMASIVPAVRARGLPVTLTVVLGASTQYAGPDSDYPGRCLTALRTALEPGVLTVVEQADDIDDFYRSAAVLVAPGRYVPHDRVPAEAWSRVVEEALFCGLPVVATEAVPAAVELVQGGQSGFVVPVDDDSAIVDAICRVLAENGHVGVIEE
jgi:glycosyltransferase involved in cell wall biosynthesis